jgi:predicted transcriptional regulator
MITGKYLRELRETKGISQSELARRVGISQAHIAKIELERVDPRLSTINKVLAVLREEGKAVRCKDVMERKLISASPKDAIMRIAKLMRKFDISQLPVMEKGLEVGSITESTIVRNLERNLRRLRVRDIMERPFPIVSSEDSVEVAKSLLEFNQAVLVGERGKIVGIITKSDLLGLL